MNDENAVAKENDIAVIGMACRFPGAKNPEEYWNLLKKGDEARSELSDEELSCAGVADADIQSPNYVKSGMFLDEMEGFDPGFFGLSPLDGQIMDPQHRHFLECSWEALEDACQNPADFDGEVGVFGGSGQNSYLPSNLLSNPALLKDVGHFLLRHTGNDKDFLTTRVSYALDLKGPSVNVQTACSTSLVAVHLAIQSLLSGECDMALAGGVTIDLPHRRGYLYKENEILSPDGHCRPFDADSKGTVFGSGVGVIVLKRYDDAVADGDQVHAVIKSSAINNDGAEKVSYLAPSVDGQVAAIKEALEISDIAPESVSYIECHGTGTQLGDPIEVAALTQAYTGDVKQGQYCGIGSVKSNIGHLDTAAGVASLIKVILQLKHKKLAPTLHYVNPNESIDFSNSPFYVNSTLKEWGSEGLRRAGVSSLGVGGTNAHIILQEEPVKQQEVEDSRGQNLLLLSAKSKKSLEKMKVVYAGWLKDSPEKLADIAYTSAFGRVGFEYRSCLSAGSSLDMSVALEELDTDIVYNHRVAADTPQLIFMFAGGGAQYPNMGLGLYQCEPIFKEAVDRCLKLVASVTELDDFKQVLFPEQSAEADASLKLQQPCYALPALFIIQYAQVCLWKEWGVTPDACIGHSMGEYTAAHLAGVFSLQDTVAIVCKRGELFSSLSNGGMLSVMSKAEDLLPLLSGSLSIAAVNSDELCVVSGDESEILNFESVLENKEISFQKMHISVAAHSAMLDPILPDFLKFMQGINYSSPSVKIASNLKGGWLSESDAMSPEYWVNHLRNTVLFSDGISKICDDFKDPVLLEIGPGNTLSSIVRSHSQSSAIHSTINSIRHPKQLRDDLAYMQTSLGRLWACGAIDSLTEFYKGQDRRLISIPTYAFDHQKLWIEPGKILQDETRDRRSPDEWLYQSSWKEGSSLILDSNLPETVLMLGVEDKPFWNDWIASLRLQHVNVVRVSLGDTYEKYGDDSYCLRLDSSDDYRRLFDDHLNSGAATIVHGWTLCQSQKGFESLLAVSQALIEKDIERYRLLIVTKNSQAIGSELLPCPENAMLFGAAPVLANEIAGCFVSLVDVDDCKDRHLAQQLRLLTNELGADENSNKIDKSCVRKGQYFELEYSKAEIPKHDAPLDLAGCYILTGGLGGLGLQLAKLLATQYSGIKLALLSRSGLPDESAWNNRVQRNSRVSKRIQTVQQLRNLGAIVEVYSVDICDQQALDVVIAKAINVFGPVKGVFHTAGIIDDQLLSMKSVASAMAVIEPKVSGLLCLEESLVGQPLDFMMLYSSISAMIGTAGQIDYAAANAYLDAFAKSRRQLSGFPVCSIGWSAWQEKGMAAEIASGERQSNPGFTSFNPQLDEDDYYVSIGEDNWVLDDHRTKAGLAVMPGTGYLQYIYDGALAKFNPEENSIIEIREVFFIAPMFINSGGQLVLGLHFNKQQDGDVLTLHSANSLPDAKNQDWHNRHVEAVIKIKDKGSSVIGDINAIRSRCNLRVENINGSTDHQHMDFGYHWGCLQKINYGVDEVVAELILPEKSQAELELMHLHPGMLDFATAAGHKLVGNYNPSTDFFVPQSYGRIAIHSPLTNHVYSHVKLKQEKDSSIARFDVQIFSSTGDLLLDIDDFVVRRMDHGSLDANSIDTEKELSVDLLNAIKPAEGDDIMLRLLGHPELAHVVVSPFDFPTVLLDSFEEKGVPDVSNDLQIERPDIDADFVAPETPEQIKIAQLWGVALGIESVGIKDNFFELGGHSLLLIQLVTKINKALSVNLQVSSMFDDPSVEKWALLAAASSETNVEKPKKITRVSRSNYRR